MNKAEETYTMGLVGYQPCVGGIVRPRIKPRKMQAAARYFRKAGDLGKKEAHRYLRDIFYYGYGFEYSFRLVAGNYERSLARGDSASTFGLAMCYELGRGVERRLDTAMELFKNAADQGCAESMWGKVNEGYIGYEF